MNGSLAHSVAASFAGRVIDSAGDEAARLETAYQLAFSRSPDADERQQCSEFLTDYRTQLAALPVPADQVETQAWAALARALLSSNEFTFVD
jgi:hypothetical protein